MNIMHGLIVPNLNAPVIVDACRGIERRARQLGYQVLLASSEFGLEHERELIEQHIKTGVRGVVLYPVTRSAQDLAPALRTTSHRYGRKG